MNDTARLAMGMMNIAQQRLLHDFPFHGRFAATWRVEPTDCVPTMGVTVLDGAIRLFYAPEFVATCTLPELESVLVHEVNHLLFEHVFADPTDFPDERARIVAQEVTVNEWVAGPLPGHPIVLAQFPQLPVNEDTLTRYKNLAQPGRTISPESADDASENHDGFPKSSPPVPKIGSSVPKNGLSVPKKNHSGVEEKPQPLDDHSLWARARQTQHLSRMVIRVSMGDARAAMSPEEWSKVEPIFCGQIDKLCGDLPGAQSARLIPGTAKVNWAQVLRRHVGQALSLGSTFQRPPRRFPRLVGVVPCKIHRPKGKVMAVIDTSGSISTTTLAEISAELRRMSQHYEVAVVECDAAIQAIYPFSNEITTVHGRGGTDLRPPFQAALLRKIHPDVIVFFTDGDGPAPLQPPRVPVIWCLASDGERPAPWGRVVQMP